MLNKTIGIDVDGCCADLISTWLFDKYNVDYRDNLFPKDITNWNIHEFVKPECGMKIYDYIEDPSIYDNVLPIKDTLSVITHLRIMGYKIIFVTNAARGTEGRKFKWLNDYSIFSEGDGYIETEDKSNIPADYLIDDYPKNISSFRNGVGVLFSAPYNLMSLHTPRCNGWKEVYRFFKKEADKA